MTGVSTFGNGFNGFADGYMESEKWRLFPTLELIVKYKNIVFQDGRIYIVGKGAGRSEITDLISLFRFLQTTKNYAIFNNLLNVMLIFIIDYNAEILNDNRMPSINLIEKYINKYYRWLYKERDNQIILVNSFIYEIEKKEVDYYSVAFNKRVIDYIASNWDKCFDELLTHFTQQRSSSLSPDKETQLSIKKRRFFPDRQALSWRWQAHDGGINPVNRLPLSPGLGTQFEPETSLLIFHGQPKPDQVADPVIKNHWR
jgi:hypothetical protein